jgi:hypothetical protein
MLNFVENLLENERDPRSGPMNDQDHSLSLSDPDRSLVQNLASCHTAFTRDGLELWSKFNDIFKNYFVLSTRQLINKWTKPNLL